MNRDVGFTIEEAARIWRTETASAERRFHILERSGLVTNKSKTEAVGLRREITPTVRLALTEMMQQDEV